MGFLKTHGNGTVYPAIAKVFTQPGTPLYAYLYIVFQVVSIRLDESAELTGVEASVIWA
ncbi:MAG: hypothetical protein Q7U57_18190 [Methylovulum sp.]|nr:hypothetical protein [Methylovulum sp.]